MRNLPESLRKKWKEKKITDTFCLYMKYWGIDSTKKLLETPIPVYLQMFSYMERDLKEQVKQLKKGRKDARK
ncbi:hypothetical protein DRO54_05495 [Candidatus Bathyarchaeota archaeon]|mgnify:CR=1 FL=1|nr:MAG: hypothetical protein DRO54_05495 [Candidatus Bathyarchaeota archaeon]RLI55402.1 MAG: hypothetical protein DRP09_09905 [Candidatus Thorarchaeota archaeon]